MIRQTSRRALLGAALTLSVGLSGRAAAAPREFPRVPTDWDAEGMFTGYDEKPERGVSFPGPVDRLIGYMAFDPQCPWCMRLLTAWLPLRERVDLRWMPCACLNIHSEPQGALILAAADRPAKLLEHEEHFRDADFRGLRYDAATLPLEAREAVWENTKIFRKAACRLIPFGVARDSAGRCQPLYSGQTTKDIAAAFGLAA